MSRRNVIAYLKARLFIFLPSHLNGWLPLSRPYGAAFPQQATIIVPLRGGISTTGYHYHTPTGRHFHNRLPLSRPYGAAFPQQATIIVPLRGFAAQRFMDGTIRRRRLIGVASHFNGWWLVVAMLRVMPLGI